MELVPEIITGNHHRLMRRRGSVIMSKAHHHDHAERRHPMSGTNTVDHLDDFVVRKPNPPPFLTKTYMLVDDPSTNGVISWTTDGTAFVVWQPAEFARDLLPTLFKHSNFSSFVRQLNTYGFRKVATSRWEFCNTRFLKGKRELLSEIRRRKPWSSGGSGHTRQHQRVRRPQLHPPPANLMMIASSSSSSVLPPPPPATTTLITPKEGTGEDLGLITRSSSTNSSSSADTVMMTVNALMDENRVLKEENLALRSELVRMKRKCGELLAMYYNRSGSSGEEEKEEEGREDHDTCCKRPKLFGVRLEIVKGNHTIADANPHDYDYLLQKQN